MVCEEKKKIEEFLSHLCRVVNVIDFKDSFSLVLSLDLFLFLLLLLLFCKASWCGFTPPPSHYVFRPFKSQLVGLEEKQKKPIEIDTFLCNKFLLEQQVFILII